MKTKNLLLIAAAAIALKYFLDKRNNQEEQSESVGGDTPPPFEVVPDSDPKVENFLERGRRRAGVVPAKGLKGYKIIKAEVQGPPLNVVRV